jgi:hypothetical protein
MEMPQKVAILLTLSLVNISAGTVTLVTHGMDSNAKTWVTDMCMAMQRYQQTQGSESDVFYVEVPRQSSVLALPQFIVKQLTTNSTSPDRNIIIAFDWNYYATSTLFGAFVDFNTGDVVQYPTFLLRMINPLPGIEDPLVEHPLHLVGHSRGGSLLSGVCDRLAEIGLPVAHLTTLDPRAHPTSLDIPPHVAATVLFADNYYQTNDTLTFGSYMAEAYNRTPILWDNYLSTTPPVPLVSDGHTDIHNWYHRTIEKLTQPADTVMQGFYKAWFSPDDEDGAKTGYYFEFCPQGVRPFDGYRARRLGHPRLTWTLSDDHTNSVFSVQQGATGKYFFDVSPDLTRWVSITNAIFLDGRPHYETNSVASLPGKAIYFRMHSIEKAF